MVMSLVVGDVHGRGLDPGQVGPAPGRHGVRAGLQTDEGESEGGARRGPAFPGYGSANTHERACLTLAVSQQFDLAILHERFVQISCRQVPECQEVLAVTPQKRRTGGSVPQ